QQQPTATRPAGAGPPDSKRAQAQEGRAARPGRNRRVPPGEPQELPRRERNYGAEFGSVFVFFSSRRRHTRSKRDWSSDVCSSDLEEPQDAALEVRMAAAGPLTSFAIAGVLGALWYVGGYTGFPVAVMAVLRYNAFINVALGAFNLIPAFPLDGGRVLRGGLWQSSKNLLKATRKATRVSEILSLLMIFAGLSLIVLNPDNIVNGIWIIFLGWFIRSGAETSLRQTQMTEALHGVSVGDIMTRNLLTVAPNLTVQQLVNDYFLVHPHGGYPVVQNDKLQGVVTMGSVRSIPREKREFETVAQAMVPYERIVTINSTASAAYAMQKMAKNQIGRLVVTEGDRILGI